MNLTARPLTASDLEWLEPFYRKLMQPYYDSLGIVWIEENFYKGIDYSISQVVLVDGMEAGYLKTELRTDCLYVGDIALKAGFQSLGIGSSLMKKQIMRASIAGLPVKLRVLKGNRAIDFYKQLGFSVDEELDVALMMRREVDSGMEIGLIGGVEKRDIVIADYDSSWPKKFEENKQKIIEALGDRALSIEHIGSTSVAGIAAKPIIDIDVVVKDSSDEDSYLPPLIAAGYELRVREPDWHEHRMLRTPECDVHIHIFSPGAEELDRHLIFRNWLRDNDVDRLNYESTKRALAQKSWNDMNDYAKAKTEVVERILTKASQAS